jgi:hypothetical protein
MQKLRQSLATLPLIKRIEGYSVFKMVDRLQYQAPSVFTERKAEINYDDGTVNLIDQLSGAFLDVAQKAHRNQLEIEIEAAKQNGTLDGSTEGMRFKPSKRGGIVHRNYNASGIQAATIKMSMNSQEAIQRISMANPGNPFAQKEAFTAWADKFANELPDEMVAPFRQSFDQLASAQLTKANAELSDIRQSEAVAQFNQLESTFSNTIESFAPRMFEAGAVGTDAAKAVETLRKNYIEMLAQNGPGAEYSVGGYRIPQGQGRSGAFSVEEIGKKLEEFDKEVLSSAVKGNFLKELEAGRGVGGYFNFVKGNTALTTVGSNGEITQMSVADMLDNEEQEKIASFMRTHISTLNSFEAAEDTKADRIRTKYNESVLDLALQRSFSTEKQPDGTEIVVGNPDQLRLQYLNAVNDQTGMVRLETIETLQNLMETVGTGDIADPSIVSKTKLGIIERDIKSVSQLPQAGLGDKARGEMVELTRKINSGQHWSNSQRYTTMIDLGKSALAPEAATGFTLFSDPNKQSSADFAEFKETLMNEILGAEQAGTLPGDINALPGKDEFDIQGRAKEIIKEIKERRAVDDTDPELTAINEKIKAQNDILNNTDTPDLEAKKARDELKRLINEKSRIQTNNQFNIGR